MNSKEFEKRMSELFPDANTAAIPARDAFVTQLSDKDAGPSKTKTIYGEVQIGDLVISAGNNDYRYLIGEVLGVTKLGTPEHAAETENDTDAVHVDFTAFEYPPERIAEIEEHFSDLYGVPKTFDELPLDDVIMAPDMLISITNLDYDEITRMGNLRQNCEAFCNCFPGGGEPRSDRHSELLDRVEHNWKDYQKSLLDFGKQELIDMAGKISAVSDAYSYMTYWHGFDEDELDYYLEFQNPLEVLADEWNERRRDLDDMSFAMEHVYRESDTLLERYPVIYDYEPPADFSLRRFMGVDLIDFLGKISDKVIVHHPNDFKIDIDRLYRAAGSENPEDKRLMWHVSSWGTHINTERETFIRDTGAYSAWVNYRPKDPDMFGYAIEVTGRSGSIVTGNVFEIGDYYAHSLHVRENALVLDAVSLTYSDNWGVNAGKTITVPRYEYDNDRNRLMSESGDVYAIQYHPSESVRKISDLLYQERSKRMVYPIGSMKTHLDNLTAKLEKIRELFELDAPPSPAKKKTSIITRIAEAGEEAKAYNAQRAQNPTATTKKHDKELD